MDIKHQVLCPRGESLADWAESTGGLVLPLLLGSATRCHCPLSVLWSSGDPRFGSPSPTSALIGEWNGKVGSQELPEVTGKFGLEVQKKAG